MRDYESWLEHVRDETRDAWDFSLADLLATHALASYRPALASLNTEATPRWTEMLDAARERLDQIRIPVAPTTYMKDRMRLAFKLARAARRHLRVKSTPENVISLMAVVCPHRISEKAVSRATVHEVAANEIDTLRETMRRAKWFPDKYQRWRKDKRWITRGDKKRAEAERKAAKAIRKAQQPVE